MRISDWSSDVCSSDLPGAVDARRLVIVKAIVNAARLKPVARLLDRVAVLDPVHGDRHSAVLTYAPMPLERRAHSAQRPAGGQRSEEHTSELQSLMRISYAVFCLKKKTALITSTILTNH